MIINITRRQAALFTISLTMMYGEIAKSGEGHLVKEEVMELAKLITEAIQNDY